MDCQYNIRCSDVKQDLDRIGVEAACDTCLDVFCRLAEEGGWYSAFVLTKLDADVASVLAVENDATVWEQATCVHTRMHPIGLCSMQDCLAWIDYEQTGNCFRVFTRGSKPTVRDISCVLGVTEADARDLLNKGRATAARYYLRDSSARKQDKTVCSSCGKPVAFEVEGWGYCSRRCAIDKPPLHNALEAQFNQPLRDVLEQIKGLDGIAHDVLGVDQRTIDLLYRRLGVSLETALALRAFKDDKYHGRWSTYSQFADDYFEEHGYPSSRGTAIRDRIDTLVDNLWRHQQ